MNTQKRRLIRAAESIARGYYEVANDYLDDYAYWARLGSEEPTIRGMDVWHTRLVGRKGFAWDGDSFHRLLEGILTDGGDLS